MLQRAAWGKRFGVAEVGWVFDCKGKMGSWMRKRSRQWEDWIEWCRWKVVRDCGGLWRGEKIEMTWLRRWKTEVKVFVKMLGRESVVRTKYHEFIYLFIFLSYNEDMHKIWNYFSRSKQLCATENKNKPKQKNKLQRNKKTKNLKNYNKWKTKEPNQDLIIGVNLLALIPYKKS